MSKLVERECPNCGGAIKSDDELQFIKCEYCDTEFEPLVSQNNGNNNKISDIYKSIVIPKTYQNIKQKNFSVLKKIILGISILVTVVIVVSIIIVVVALKSVDDDDASNIEIFERLEKSIATYDGEEYTSIIEGLVVKGVNATDSTGRTPLMWASTGGYIEIIESLIAGGAQLDMKDGYGNTALMHAVSYGHIKVAKILMEAGADINASTEHGSTALNLASQEGYTEIVKLLKASGAIK